MIVISGLPIPPDIALVTGFYVDNSPNGSCPALVGVPILALALRRNAGPHAYALVAAQHRRVSLSRRC